MYRNTIRIMRGIGMAAAVSLAVAACTDAPKSSALRASAATERKSGLTPAEKQLRARAEEKRKVDSAVTGAAGGAIAGALVGGLLGGWRGAAIGAVTGAAGGAAAGLAYGSYMNAKARHYSNAEARATAVSKGADQTLDYYRRVNAASQTILNEQQVKIARLNEEYRSGAITKERYRKELSTAGTNEGLIKDQIQGLDQQLAAMRADPQSLKLTSQVQELQQQRDTLQGTYDRLIELYGTVPSEVRAAQTVTGGKSDKPKS